MQRCIVLLALIVCIRAGGIPTHSPSRSPSPLASKRSPSRLPTPSPSRRPTLRSPSPSRLPMPSRSPAATPAPSPFPSPLNPMASNAPGFVFGAYIDVIDGMDWSTNVISTAVTGPSKPVTAVVPAGSTVTWGSAMGVCGSELFAGGGESAIYGDVLASNNVPKWVAAGQKYIISTGGHDSGIFLCKTDAGFNKFIQRFWSSSLVGVDFDTGYLVSSPSGASDIIDQLVQRTQAAMVTYPTLRWSWTLGSRGAATGDNLDSIGQMVMKTLVKYNISWKSQYINLRPNHFGAADPAKCAVVNGECDMAQSAINAVETLHAVYGVPYDRIELTPFIGGDALPPTLVHGNVFSVANATAVAKYVRSRGLGGLHYLTLDRDTDCPAGTLRSPYCNSYGMAGVLGFTNAFSRALASP